ncbi:tetratricopeptide-like helical domain-containing protein [Artemisia annua]|uniref:Tetratricopeptide-like helical domain-containing protein n=1 Tax=Artemisia annua TaxID=35608 RepID=A0A2U1NWH6_ARTAN|nr:tetratricopeptide-like helical domain-containing protein [Artemisia annua]
MALCRKADQMKPCVFDNILKFEKRSPSICTYNISQKGACQAKDHKRAIEIFDNMRCGTDAISYTVMISHVFEKKDFQEVVNMLNRMLCDSYVISDSKLFGSVMKGLLDQLRLQDAKMMLMLTAQQNTHFQANIVNVVLGYYCKEGSLNTGNNVSLVSKGIEFFQKNFREGKTIYAPNVITYMTIIEGLLKAGEPNLADDYLNEMVSFGFHMNQKLYDIVLNGFISNGHVQWVESYFQRPENDAFNNDVAVWNIMIKGAISNGLFGLAQAYMNEMQSRGLKPDLKTFTPLLIAFYAHNFTTDAESLVKQMKIFGILIRLACMDLQVAYRKSCLAVEKKRFWTAMKKLEKKA